MTQTIAAIYEDGVLKPITPLTGIEEHQQVRLAVQSGKPPHPLLKYCGTLPDEDAREIEKTVMDEFEKVDPDEWK